MKTLVSTDKTSVILQAQEGNRLRVATTAMVGEATTLRPDECLLTYMREGKIVIEQTEVAPLHVAVLLRDKALEFVEDHAVNGREMVRSAILPAHDSHGKSKHTWEWLLYALQQAMGWPSSKHEGT